MPLKINIANHIKKSFSTNGYKKILVNKIISELGISKKTFYQNCSSKEFLIDEILFGFIQDAYVEVIRILSTKSDFIEKYNSIFEIVEKHITVFNDSSLRALRKDYPKIWWKIIRFRKKKILPLLRLLLNYSKKKKIIHEYDSGFLIEFAYSSMNNALFITKKKKYKNGKAFYDSYQIILNGILTKKGKKFLNYKSISNKREIYELS